MALTDELPDGAVIVGHVLVIRYLTDENDLVVYEAIDGSGEELALVETLGMLRLTEDTAIRDAMGEAMSDTVEEDEDY